VDVQVTNNPEEHRYEIRADGELAGYTIYRERPGLIVFVHTEIDQRFEGHGLASQLIRTALEDAKERELQVLPFCPFVNGYIARHREYVELVPDAFRTRFGL
jgi:predicted GNAT family acetyltransferase